MKAGKQRKGHFRDISLIRGGRWGADRPVGRVFPAEGRPAQGRARSRGAREGRSAEPQGQAWAAVQATAKSECSPGPEPGAAGGFKQRRDPLCGDLRT